MASKEMKVPTIDFSKQELKPGSPQWDSTKAQVFQALQEYGCFEAIYDEVPKKTQEAMFGISKEIFEFPLETKMKNLSTKPLDGYKGQFPSMPLYESLSIDDMLKPQNVDAFANIFWPDGNPHFLNELKSYSKPLVEFDEMVKRMVLESLGLKNYIDEFLDPNIFSFRFTHYKAAQGEEFENKIGLSDHTDRGFLTIISQNQVNGLQVFKKNGELIDVNIAPNSFAVLAGDSFMAWTNGRVHAPVHRVTMADRDSDRFSISLFSVPKSGYTIEAPKELVGEEHPLLFKPYDIDGLYEYVASKAGRTIGAAGAFKAYCGV
ncbi:hypothetical protein HAX54_024611 [Datura stramonium]|uniref:Fe2OG dioxygenase domain-containing protein n=1 Tax=Datura stramonium TaxID=4076 RepID=A0ABS8RG71_DATST|nr:hypothetical protein [Datura stramonium]